MIAGILQINNAFPAGRLRSDPLSDKELTASFDGKAIAGKNRPRITLIEAPTNKLYRKKLWLAAVKVIYMTFRATFA